jgi:hypothetical protein
MLSDAVALLAFAGNFAGSSNMFMSLDELVFSDCEYTFAACVKEMAMIKSIIQPELFLYSCLYCFV